MIAEFKHQRSAVLAHAGGCEWLYATPECFVALEYADEEQVDVLVLDAQGELQTRYVDVDALPVTAPAESLRSHQPSQHPLNFGGGRWRGLRELERVSEWANPLSVMEKMPLLQALGWNIPPMRLLGLVQSQVLSSAPLASSGLSFICRRVGLALALAQVQQDAGGEAYDYETRWLYVAHLYDPQQDPPPLLTGLSVGGVRLGMPMSVLVQGTRLALADGGTADLPNRLHWFEIAYSAEAS